MSIVMVGPFPGPFDRTHYSDSTSETPANGQMCPPRPEVPTQRTPPGPYLSLLLQDQPRARTPGTPRDSVPSSAARRDSATSSPAYFPVCQEPRPESLQQPPTPHRGPALLKRKCYALLCRLAVAALALITIAVLVTKASRSARRGAGVGADTAPVKAGNAAVRGANGTDREGGAATHAATTVAARGHRAHSTITPPAEPRHHKHRHGGTGHGRTARPSSPLSSSPSSSSSSSLSSTTMADTPWPTTEPEDRDAPAEPALRDVDHVAVREPGAGPTTSAGAQRATDAPSSLPAWSPLSPTDTVAPASSGRAFSGEKASGDGWGSNGGQQGGLGTVAEPSSSQGSPAAPPTTGAVSVATATTVASTDLPEVINEADARADVQEV